MTRSLTEDLEKVWEEYNLGKLVQAKKLSGGVINATYHVANEEGSEYIVQRLQGVFGERLMDDIEIITEHLAKEGWDCPTLVRTKEGRNHVLIQSEIWRVYRYIKAKSFSPDVLGPKSYLDVGRLLGSLHKSLSTLKYVPLHKIEGFHEKDFYVKKALEIKQDSYSRGLQEIVKPLIDRLEEHAKNLKDRRQLIHGDPRIENILFSSENKPITFIDCDTFMLGSLSIDIGDCLRSLMSLEDRSAFSERLGQCMTGYHAENPAANVSSEEAVSALKYITAELALRFAIDAVEQNYFSWDSRRYASAAEHNEVRAMELWDLYNRIENEL